MGARQSKRSVDISGTPKKGGELENGAVATNVEEKLEKIAEADSAAAKVNANGSTTTTSTVTAEQQETAAAATVVADSTTLPPAAESGETPSVKTEESSEEAEKPAEVSTTTVDENKSEPTSPASPSENAPSSNEEAPSSEKKKKPKKKWSFRSFSFSKKDKVKPASKEEKQETVPEGNENTQSEQVNSAEATNVTPVQSEEPPPLPTSPPPTPADETAEKEETPTISEGDVDASGGGEGLAEPIEEAELDESPTPAVPAPEEPVASAAAVAAVTAAATPLVNGVSHQNGDYKEQNGKHAAEEEEDENSPVHERKPSVDSVTAKIGSLKLQIASETSEQPAQNGVSNDETATLDLNGVKENDVSSTENATAVATVEN